MSRPRSIREIADLVSEARDDLRKAIQSLEQIVGAHPKLGPLSMNLKAIRTLLKEVLENLRALEG